MRYAWQLITETIESVEAHGRSTQPNGVYHDDDDGHERPYRQCVDTQVYDTRHNVWCQEKI